MNSLLLGFFSFLFATTCTAAGLSISLSGSFHHGFSARLIQNFRVSYGGTVSNEKGRMFLILEGAYAKLVVAPINPDIKEQISKLKSGDFLSVEAFYDQENSVLHVSSVNYVGLKDLIGNWSGDDNVCYKFKDFNTLSIYNKTDKNKCDFSIGSMAREFSYFISPAYPDWSVLLSDDSDSYLMDLTLKSKNNAELSLYDSRSGDILKQVRIKRLKTNFIKEFVVSIVPTASHLFFTKNDPQDPRLGEYFKPTEMTTLDIKPDDVVIVGYPDDEGIKMNGGRSGSAEGPKFIRQFLYKMTWPYKKKLERKYLDIGDINPIEIIENKHEHALQIAEALHKKKAFTISFGGGHDYGYSDTAGFVKSYLASGHRPLVINFDAHLDVRPTQNGPNSGTPFYRLLSEFSEKIDFVEVGLQPQCNSIYHREWAQNKNAFLYDLKDLQNGNLMDLLNKPPFSNLKSKTPVYVSFDIDALTSSEAGGCSQSWVTGLRTQDCFDFLSELYRRSDCRGLGIYEVSPPLDTDFRTSKTAALLAYNFIFRG